MSTKLKAGTATSGAVIDADTSGVLELQSGSTPTTAITVDTSQNVGIGTSTPTVYGSYKTLEVRGTGGGLIQFGTGTSTASYLFNDGTNTGFQNIANGVMTFATNNTERMRIDSSGNLLVNRTSTVATPASRASKAYFSDGVTTTDNGTNTATYEQLGVWFNSGAWRCFNQAGVGMYLTNGATAWSNTSDERVKDIIEPITDATNKVSSLRAVIGKYKKDEEGTRRSFLIAQDVQAVLPEAVTELDGVLGVNYTDVIPLLIASIQELNAKVTALEAQLGVK